MQEYGSEILDCRHEQLDRPMGYGKDFDYGFGYKKHFPYGGGYNFGYGYPNYWYSPYFSGGYYGGLGGWPWFLLALKSIGPREAARFLDELDRMNY